MPEKIVTATELAKRVTALEKVVNMHTEAISRLIAMAKDLKMETKKTLSLPFKRRLRSFLNLKKPRNCWNRSMTRESLQTPYHGGCPG